VSALSASAECAIEKKSKQNRAIHRVRKKHPEHYRLSLEDGFTNFNNFGINISGTTGHQMTGYFTTSSNVCFCTTWEKLNQRNMQ